MSLLFLNVVKFPLKQLSLNKHPVLSAHLFLQIWLTFGFNRSLMGMMALLISRSFLKFVKLGKGGVVPRIYIETN